MSNEQGMIDNRPLSKLISSPFLPASPAYRQAGGRQVCKGGVAKFSRQKA